MLGTDRRIIVLIGDGMGGRPLQEPFGKTTIEAAKIAQEMGKTVFIYRDEVDRDLWRVVTPYGAELHAEAHEPMTESAWREFLTAPQRPTYKDAVIHNLMRDLLEIDAHPAERNPSGPSFEAIRHALAAAYEAGHQTSR